MLAVLGAAQGEFTPVQIQKLFFILDRKAEAQLGRHFDFRPYNYGPYDPAVYHEVQALAARGLAFVDGQSRFRRYRITDEGTEAAAPILAGLPGSIQQYIRDVAHFVRSKSFAELVSAIYHEWPEMKANSIFHHQ